MPTTTITVVIIAACVTTALSSLILGIWLYRRHKHRRPQGSSTSTRGDYKEFQRRKRPSPRQPDSKHLSVSTTSASSSRHSTLSVSDPEKQDLADLEAQQTEPPSHDQQPTWQSQITKQMRRSTSLSSVYSFCTENPPQEPAKSPQQHLRAVIPTQQTTLKPDSPNRAISARVPNYHTIAEYSTLIDADVQALMSHESLPPPPPLPRKPSRRSSEPPAIDGYLAASMRLEAGLGSGVPLALLNEQRARSVEAPREKFEWDV